MVEIYISAALATSIMGYFKVCRPCMASLKDVDGALYNLRTLHSITVAMVLMFLFAPLFLPVLLFDNLTDKYVEGVVQFEIARVVAKK